VSRAEVKKKEVKTGVLTSRGGGVMQAKPSAACSLPCQAGLLLTRVMRAALW
jgi:hypothetical protein